MAIKLRLRKGKDGKLKPLLDIHHLGKRWTEFLPLLEYKENPKTLSEKIEQREKKEILARIVKERELQLLYGEYEVKQKYNNKVDFFEYVDEYINNYPNKGDLRTYTSMRLHLKLFVKKPKLYAFEIDEAFLRRFVKHLETNLNYETPSDYFKKLKKILKLAVKQNIFKSNPAEDIRLKTPRTQEKEILSPDEIKLLKESRCCNNQVKSAFLFAYFTGLRYIDIKRLKWKNIVADNLTITQSKTGIPVEIPIHPSAMELLNIRKSPDEFVFILPSHTGCLKGIRNWVKAAGIEKHITFHCARHSVGSQLIANGIDLSTTSRLLGHTSVKTTMRYVRTSQILKEKAINTLQII